jgi:pimeloyl-ACP methyl ester carboxylesterase
VAEFVDDAEAIDPVPVAAVAETPVTLAVRRFQTRCVGTGEPAVVLVSGANVPQATWHRVQAKVAPKSRVCTYDRLGIGDSGPRPARQTLEQLARDLDELIDALRLPRPVVVVGHSLGGEIAMVWAASHPTDTAGVVLIDAASAGYEREYDKQVQEHYPNDVQLNAGFENVDTSSALAQLDALPRLDAVPLVVLTHTLSKPDPNYPQIDWNAFERAWIEGQRHWATYSRVSEMVLVENAGHFIHFDQLNTVVAAVLRML